MELRDEQAVGSFSNEARALVETHGSTLEEKMAELERTREELKGAKESAMQSWLDSRPLIDELETLKSELTAAKDRSSMSSAVLSELESQLQTTNRCIRSKKEEELKANENINKISHALEQTREELEQQKLETDEERSAIMKLKQIQRLRKLTLRTLQLTVRAARIESEAFEASTAYILSYVNNPEMGNANVQLTYAEYHALKQRAKEETSLADWRISVSVEQRLAAEASRNLALSRLKRQHPGRPARETIEEGQIPKDGRRELDEQDRKTRESQLNNREFAFPKDRAKLISESDKGNPQQNIRKSKSRNKIKKKVLSLCQIKRCIEKKITRLF